MKTLQYKIKKARNSANNLEKTVFLLIKESKMRKNTHSSIDKGDFEEYIVYCYLLIFLIK